MLIIHRATSLWWMALLMCRDTVLLETTEIIELWGTRLEWTTQQQLRRQKGSEVHVHCCARCCDIAWALEICLPVRSSVDRHVPATRMPLSIASKRVLV